jgi:hypothetical protein
MASKKTGQKLPQPRRSGRAWTSFVADTLDGAIVRGLHEQSNPRHRLRVEHDPHTRPSAAWAARW